MIIDSETERRVIDLHHRYAECLDDGRLDDWPEFFTEDGRYVIHPRDNREMGLEGYWLYFEGKRMLRDRVVSLKDVNIYAIHYERRSLTKIRVSAREGEVLVARANYTMWHTDVEGRSRLFSVGEYRDRIVERAGQLRFAERIAVVDTFVVESHISTPI